MKLCFIIMWLNFVRIQNSNIGKYGRTIVKQVTWIANFLQNSSQFSKIIMKFDKINQIWNFCGSYKPHNSNFFIDVSCKCFVFKILISKKGKQPYFCISIEKIIFRRLDDKYSLNLFALFWENSEICHQHDFSWPKFEIFKTIL